MLSYADSAELRIVRDVLVGRFGIPARVMEEWLVFSTGSVLWGLRDAPDLDKALEAFRIERTGLPLLRRAGDRWKPTTVALQVLGRYVSKSLVQLSREELERLLSDAAIRGTITGVDQGYVAVAGPDGVAGCALYLEPQTEEGKEEGLLCSQFPKARWQSFGHYRACLRNRR